MQKSLIAVIILVPLVSTLPSNYFTIDPQTTTTLEARVLATRANGRISVVLTGQEFQGLHACAADSVCDCWYEDGYELQSKQVVVDCSERNLTEASKLLTGLDHPIGELHLNGNRLTRAPDMTKDGYETVSFLLLFDNRIENISVETISPRLVVLSLSYNRISRIDEKVLKKLKDLRHLAMLTLDYNPLICDCKSMSSLKMLQSIKRYGRDTATCAGAEIKIDDLKIDELCTNRGTNATDTPPSTLK